MSLYNEQKDPRQPRKMKEKKLEGIGGWLILPIIGFSITILLQLLDLMDSFLYYNLEDVFVYMAGNLLVIAFSSVALIMIFKKKKEAITWAIVALSINGFINLIGAAYVGVIGSVIWIFYFIKSERVKNTFVK